MHWALRNCETPSHAHKCSLYMVRYMCVYMCICTLYTRTMYTRTKYTNPIFFYNIYVRIYILYISKTPMCVYVYIIYITHRAPYRNISPTGMHITQIYVLHPIYIYIYIQYIHSHDPCIDNLRSMHSYTHIHIYIYIYTVVI